MVPSRGLKYTKGMQRATKERGRDDQNLQVQKRDITRPMLGSPGLRGRLKEPEFKFLERGSHLAGAATTEGCKVPCPRCLQPSTYCCESGGLRWVGSDVNSKQGPCTSFFLLPAFSLGFPWWGNLTGHGQRRINWE